MPGGRPSKYNPDYPRQARALCMLGATDADMARSFGVAISTVSKWLAEMPEFSVAIKEGREFADATVASRLYSRACGYEHQAVKIVADAKTGAEHVVPYTERYPPDTVACIFWLKNRRPDLWREKSEVAQTVVVKDERAETEAQLKDIFGPVAGIADKPAGGGKVVH